MFRQLSKTGIQMHIRQQNEALNGALKLFEWTPSQRKLIRITQVMNTLEGERGREVFEMNKSLVEKIGSVTAGNVRKKYNEPGAYHVIEEIKAIIESENGEVKA